MAPWPVPCRALSTCSSTCSTSWSIASSALPAGMAGGVSVVRSDVDWEYV
ncbi:hypothetical protein [Paracidovorax avenae]|nr:hypothetical protein [Paracidovorax avenae]